jgi:RHS repeat-associated protein
LFLGAFIASAFFFSVEVHGYCPGSYPTNNPVTVLWSLVEGPAEVRFLNMLSSATPVIFYQPGDYWLRLTATDGQLSGSDEVIVTVQSRLNVAPFVYAGSSQRVTLPSPARFEFAVLDEGLPLGGQLISFWTLQSGPGTVTFATNYLTGTIELMTNLVTFSRPGTYVLRLTATDGSLTNYDEVIVEAVAGENHAPVVEAGPELKASLTDAAVFSGAQVSDDGLPYGLLESSWTTVSGPGPVQFTTLNGVWHAHFSEVGSYVLRLQATDGALTNTDDVTITVMADLGPPVAQITIPTNNAALTAPTVVTGTVSSSILDFWQLEYRLKPASSLAPTGADGQGEEASWTTLATGSNAVLNGPLGTFDPTLLLNGIYELQLTVIDQIGRTALTDPLTVIVEKNLKIGHFTVSFNDLTIPVAGVPIQITRTYDSRAAQSGVAGDFGAGWTLDLRNIRLQKNRNLGLDWEQTSTGGSWPMYGLDPVRPRIVTITFPDGRVSKFSFQPDPMVQPFFPIEYPRWRFVPLPGTQGTLVPASYHEPDGEFLLVIGGAPEEEGSVPVDLFDLNYWTDHVLSGALEELYRYPTLFEFTTLEGYRYWIDELEGLKRLTDPNGNTLVLTTNGITWTNTLSASGGEGQGEVASLTVAFQRDDQGRITNIVDAAGQSMTYVYDANNNLTAFVDRAGNTNAFGYDGQHHLLTLTDARGVIPVRNEYDEQGRLVRHTDAFGKIINYTHDTSNRQEIIEDRLGNVTVHEYDDRGNVVRSVAPDGGVIRMAYDANDNLLEQVDPLGRTNRFSYDAQDNRITATDPLGNTTRFTYNSMRRVTSVIDPRGNTITNAFDTQGNLLAMRDPLGRMTRFTYNDQGLPTAMTNALGQVMRFIYDDQGRLTNELDAVGHATSYERDDQGNLLRQTTTRTKGGAGVPPVIETLTVQFQYDAQSRLTNSIFPDGSTASTIYNTIGKPAVTIDQQGRQTITEYDELGRVTRTIYPDGNSDSSGYDAEGRRVFSTNRVGQVTRFDYDTVGRLWRTVYPDGSSTTNYFDLAGQLVASTDPCGVSTFYGYDDAGRSVAMTNALGQVSRSFYDASGNLTNSVDALGRSTTFIYDALNRRVQTVYADGTTQTTWFDALGRRTHEQDQAGKVTAYAYDTLGRLTAVTNALGYVTSYAYDELGQQISQTDANNHTTTFEYDSLGRRTKRTLPGNQIETYAYSVGGLLTNKTDFNGYVTTFQYDLMNRLLQRTPDSRLLTSGSSAVTYGYNVLGLRTNMTDASGATAYAYDRRNRLVQKTKSFGASSTSSLMYAYDANGNVTNILSSDPNGVDVGYEYDALNRLRVVNDVKVGRTAYTYDEVGNLKGYTYPNFVHSEYQYDALNRLTNLTGSRVFTPIANYAYTLGPSGNRLTASETILCDPLNPVLHTIDRLYTYDHLYRLTGEDINVVGTSSTSSLTYEYDPVGNRLARQSTLAELLPQLFTFDANDRLNSDTYDANGNTVVGRVSPSAPPVNDSYDFENRLITRHTPLATVHLLYDGDGNRVCKTVITATNTVTTFYVVDELNPTGYAQVLEEHVSINSQPPVIEQVYTYGHTLISQDRLVGMSGPDVHWATSFYGYDGHNNVRYLTDLNGSVTDTYDYDAFGNLIARTGNTPNNYLFTSEQYDLDLGLYYLRARYHNPDTGRFWTQDSFEGFGSDPSSLHKYTYCANNPVNAFDPSGLIGLPEVGVSTAIGAGIGAIFGAAKSGIEGYIQGLRGWDLVSATTTGAKSGAVGGVIGGLAGGAFFAAKSFFAAYKTVGFLFNAVGGGFLAYGFGRDMIDVYEAQSEGNTTLACFRAGFAVSMGLFSHPKVFPWKWFTNRPIKPWKDVQAELVVPHRLNTVTRAEYCYVVTESRELRICLKRGGAHKDLAQGQPVLAAGEFQVSNGKFDWINNESGSYRPRGLKARDAAAGAFSELGLGDIVPTYFEVPSQ